MEADRILVGARAVNERHWISKEEYFGRVTFCAQILLLKMNPVPPPPRTRAVGNIEGRR